MTKDEQDRLEAEYGPMIRCKRCGIGPFLLVNRRVHPELCLDCAIEVARWAQVSAVEHEFVTGHKPGEPFEAEADGMGESRVPRFGRKR